jgi:hypothetical protein
MKLQDFIVKLNLLVSEGFDEDSEVWMQSGKGVSSPVTEVHRLNSSDIYIGLGD